MKNIKNFILKHPNFELSGFFDEIVTREGCYILELYSYLILPNVDTFYTEKNIKNISLVVSEIYGFLLKLEVLRNKIWEFYK